MLSHQNPHYRNESSTIEDLQSQLDAARAEHRRLQVELAMRNDALDSATTHFMIIDATLPAWRAVYVNRAICESYGYCAAELLGRDPLVLVRSDDNLAVLEQINAAVRLRQKLNIELVARRKNGAAFRIGMSMTPLDTMDRGVNRYLCVGADISAGPAPERRQRELQDRLLSEMQERERMAIELRLAQKLESVGRLAAGIAHEINTPIQYIGDSVAFLRSAEADLHALRCEYRRALDSIASGDSGPSILAALDTLESDLELQYLLTEIPRAFDRTLAGVERVAEIVRAMKEFAHPDTTEQSYADLNHALETTLTVAGSEYKHHARIETRFGELPLVNCNAGELNQVFLNLIINATHALVEAGKNVSAGVITIVTAADGDQVSISISDNGCGIAEQNLERVFDPFFTTKPVGMGTGQGLAIARSIVTEKHQGHIDVQSIVGIGTTFTLHLPIKGRLTAEET
jgi:PAS domain S-box-containing protein